VRKRGLRAPSGSRSGDAHEWYGELHGARDGYRLDQGPARLYEDGECLRSTLAPVEAARRDHARRWMGRLRPATSEERANVRSSRSAMSPCDPCAPRSQEKLPALSACALYGRRTNGIWRRDGDVDEPRNTPSCTSYTPSSSTSPVCRVSASPQQRTETQQGTDRGGASGDRAPSSQWAR
jgi:hypothetical protein